MTELIWEGKYKDGRKVAPVRIALPFQTIETVNESARELQPWLLETKGQETEEVKHKDRAAAIWCENASALTDKRWRYLKVPQKEFEKLQPESLAELAVLKTN